MCSPTIPLLLKSCPFCGASGWLIRSDPFNDGQSRYRVTCVAKACANHTRTQDTPEKAAERWNKRAPNVSTEVASLQTALREARAELTAVGDALYHIGGAESRNLNRCISEFLRWSNSKVPL